MRMENQVLAENLPVLIADVIKTVKMDVPIRPMHDGINMSYNFIGKYIGYDEKRLHAAHAEMAAVYPFETYVQAITLHELGHAMDHEALEASLPKTMDIFTMKKSYPMSEIFQTPELLKVLIEEDEMNIVFEETAWNNASLMNVEYKLVDPLCFEAIRNSSLATYITLYDEDVRHYEKLLDEQHISTK